MQIDTISAILHCEKISLMFTPGYIYYCFCKFIAFPFVVVWITIAIQYT